MTNRQLKINALHYASLLHRDSSLTKGSSDVLDDAKAYFDWLTSEPEGLPYFPIGGTVSFASKDSETSAGEDVVVRDLTPEEIKGISQLLHDQGVTLESSDESADSDLPFKEPVITEHMEALIEVIAEMDQEARAGFIDALLTKFCVNCGVVQHGDFCKCYKNEQ